MPNVIAANVFGVLGAVCWSVQLIPQIIINHRKHDTTGLQPSMMLLWACAGVPLGVYNIVESFNWALRVQPQILTLLSLVTWMQCCYYGKKWSISKCVQSVTLIAVFLGGIQAGLIIGLRTAKRRSIEWPLTLMAVLSASFLAAGVLRHYWDIYRHRTVRGISFIFVGIDAAGDLTSLISVCFQRQLNTLGLVIYGTELILWIGVFACGGYFNLRPWLRQKRRSRQSVDIAAGPAENPGGITLHDMPSSTSVFRTPSQTDASTTRRETGSRIAEDTA